MEVSQNGIDTSHINGNPTHYDTMISFGIGGGSERLGGSFERFIRDWWDSLVLLVQIMVHLVKY